MKYIFKKISNFISSWTGSLLLIMVITNVGAQAFLIPSGSMKNTQLIGDYLIGTKYSYGIPIPRLPLLNTPIMPDIFGNGHLLEGERPKREDIVIFLYPKDETTNYVKRCVAIGGDEILYADKKLFIHFHEGDEYIKSHYNKNRTIMLKNKLWVENPYMEKYPGIGYRPERSNVFQHLLYQSANHHKIDMKPVFIEGLKTTHYKLGLKKMNAFYTKVPLNHYYMIGDNRDNSNDSRFWGPVPYRLIVAKPRFVLFSMEHRSYEQVLNGNENGSGRDHTDLKRVCGNVALESKECESLWSKQRFHVRWHRLGRTFDWLQKQDFSKVL
jgi:signal peptidase I